MIVDCSLDCNYRDQHSRGSTLTQHRQDEPQEETHWLSDGEMRTWIAFLQATHLIDDAVDRDLQTQSGLTHGDFEMLVRLSAAPDLQMRMADLAQQVLISRSRLTYRVTRLEKMGLITRQSCPTDARGAFAVLSPQGLQALQRAAPKHVKCVRHVFFDALTPDQVQILGDMLELVTVQVRKAPSPAHDGPETPQVANDLP